MLSEMFNHHHLSGALSSVLLVLNPSHPWNVSLDTGLVSGSREGRASFFVGIQCGGIMTHFVSNILQGQVCAGFAAGTMEINAVCFP